MIRIKCGTGDIAIAGLEIPNYAEKHGKKRGDRSVSLTIHLLQGTVKLTASHAKVRNVQRK